MQAHAPHAPQALPPHAAAAAAAADSPEESLEAFFEQRDGFGLPSMSMYASFACLCFELSL